jgi:hypothetical protein
MTDPDAELVMAWLLASGRASDRDMLRAAARAYEALRRERAARDVADSMPSDRGDE